VEKTLQQNNEFQIIKAITKVEYAMRKVLVLAKASDGESLCTLILDRSSQFMFSANGTRIGPPPALLGLGLTSRIEYFENDQHLAYMETFRLHERVEASQRLFL
jgi:hypothetical protein